MRVLFLIVIYLVQSVSLGQGFIPENRAEYKATPVIPVETSVLEDKPATTDPANAVGLVARTDNSTGSCVVIEKTTKLKDGWLGLAVTANHVMEHQSSVKVTYFTGRRAMGCAVVAANNEVDLAIIRVWVPDEVTPVSIETENPDGDVLLIGYPESKPGFLSGKFLRRDKGNLYAHVLNRPGFSGGGVFHKGKLVGCISGGWYWTKDDNGKQATWPAKAADGESIASLLEKARSRK